MNKNTQYKDGILRCSNEIEGNTREVICLNPECNHKFGWHHAKQNKPTDRICYGLACTCSGFESNFSCLTPLLEKIFSKQDR